MRGFKPVSAPCPLHTRIRANLFQKNGFQVVKGLIMVNHAPPPTTAYGLGHHSINDPLPIPLPLPAPAKLCRVHSLLHKAWPDGDVDMGSDLAASRLEEMQSAAGGLLPPLGGTAAVEGFEGPQQAFAAIVARRFKVS